MPDVRLPLFPLRLVLLPGEPVPLHIFEPRYKEMTRWCVDEDQPFGIVQASEGGVATVGCTARIHRVVRRYDDGRSDIVVVGEERFHVDAVHRDLAYLTADATFLADEPGDDAAARERVVARHMKLMELAGETVRPERYAGVVPVSFVVGRHAGLDLDQRQHLLELTSEPERLGYLADHLRDLLRRVRRTRDVRERARGDGHAGLPPEL